MNCFTKTKRPLFWSVWLLLLLTVPLGAQPAKHTFVRLGVEDGLSSTEVHTLLQDRYGFIWIGTADGLNLYDGYRFTPYQRKPFDSTSISANATTALYEDRQGTLWIGTVHGLSRMNAQERAAGRFQQFLHDPANPQSLSANTISAICEDADGNLWIATRGGGLNRFDQDQNMFVQYRREPGNPFGLNDDIVLTLHRDRGGVLWVGTARGGLQKFDPSTQQFTTFTWQHPNFLPHYEQYPPAVFAFIDSLCAAQAPLAAVLQAGDGEDRTAKFDLPEDSIVLVIATGEALEPPLFDFAWLEREGESVWQMRHAHSTHGGGAAKNRIAIARLYLRAGAYGLRYRSDDSHSSQKWNAWPPHRPELWGAQIFRLNADGAGKIAPLLHQTCRPSALSHAQVNAIIDDPQPGSRTLWIATAHGLNRFDTVTETFSHYFPDSKNAAAEANFISALAEDDSGGLWIGTMAGVLRFDIKANRFVYPSETFEYGAPPRGNINTLITDHTGILWVGEESGGLHKLVPRKFSHHLLPEGGPSNQILAIYQDKKNSLWLGTAAGLVRYDRSSTRTRNFKHDPANPNSLRAGSVSFIHEDQSGNLWIGTWGGGLNRFTPATDKFVHYHFNPRDPSSISSNFLHCVAEDNNGMLWIGTAGGLNRFDPHSGRAQRFLHDPNNPHSLPANEVFSLFVDRSGALWAGTALGGLSKIDPATGRCQNYIHDPKDRSSLSNRTVTALHQDRSGTLWIGTYSGGLCALQRGKNGDEKFINYMADSGLPSNKIQAILEDEEGRLWLSTNNGVARFDPITKNVRRYTVQDGLQHAQFFRNAAWRNAAGEMFFGGSNGFNSFFPDQIRDDPRPAPVVLTQFKKFDHVQRFDRPLAVIENIALRHDENFFSFEFVALDYAGAENVQYAYKLEGLDQDWRYCGEQRIATYTNVDPGEYVFRVKASNHDGVWHERGASIEIAITPPFWQTAWFFLASLGATMLTAYALFQYRLRAQVRKSLELERVRFLEREKVREQIARDYHDEMGHKITKIGLFSELLTRNVNGIARELKEHLDKVLEASQSLALDARDFIWALNPEKDSLYETCLHLQEFGNTLFEESEINFQVQGLSEASAHVKLNMEWKRHLTLLFKEGMNNVLKHARCKNAVLEIEIQHGNLQMSLADDGVGLAHINGHVRNGTGVGLENMKRRAQLLHGQLEIESPEGKGTTIRFLSALPMNGY